MPATDAKFIAPNQKALPRKTAKVRRNQNQWIAIFEAQRASGLSVDAFCSANNISRSAYWKWSKQLGATKKAVAAKTSAPTFIPIPIAATPTCKLELDLGTLRIRFDGIAPDRVIDAIIQRIVTQA